MKWIIVLWVVSACFAATPVMRFGGGASVAQSERGEISRLAPGDLDSSSRWSGPVRNGRVRVWADDDYRVQNLDWQRGFDRELEAVNAVVGPMVGLHLEAEYRKWDRHAPGSTLSDALDDLGKADAGDDVVAVIGLTASLSLAGSSYEQLGYAEVGGPHVVLRGYADQAERKNLEIQLRRLDGTQREQMIEARRWHKLTTVVLHELAHSLGAIHENGDTEVMNPMYSHDATSVSPRNRELMLITLDERLKPASQRDPRVTRTKLAAALDKPWDTAIADDRTELLARLHDSIGASPAALDNTTWAVRAQEAQRLLQQGDIKGARAAIAKEMAVTPLDRKTALVVCKIELADGGSMPAACDRAAQPIDGERDPKVIVDAALVVVPAMAGAHDVRGAVHVLANAEARLGSDRTREAWLALADHYRDLDAVSAAEHALATAAIPAGADDSIGNWATTTRARYGIPRDTRDDYDAVAAVREVLALVNAGKLDTAATAEARAEKRWPMLPGLVAARCDLELHRNNRTAARELCSKAGDAGSSWALYRGGSLELEAGADRAAIARLDKAIAIDPELNLAWVALGKALAHAKATAELATLRTAYKARFHRALPE